MISVGVSRVIVRDLDSGVYHRGYRLGNSAPVTLEECETEIVTLVDKLPPDVKWAEVHDCLRSPQTMNTRGDAA